MGFDGATFLVLAILVGIAGAVAGFGVAVMCAEDFAGWALDDVYAQICCLQNEFEQKSQSVSKWISEAIRLDNERKALQVKLQERTVELDHQGKATDLCIEKIRELEERLKAQDRLLDLWPVAWAESRKHK